MIELSLLFVFAYFLGSIPFSLLLSKARGVDLRSVGSGNVGATNVYRAMGIKWAVLVFFLDAMKGLLPVLVSMRLMPDAYLSHVLVGLMCILGHSFTVWLKFKGGKGAATGLGVLMAMSPLSFGILCVLAVGIIWSTRYVSVATTICALFAPVLMVVTEAPQDYVVFVSVISIVIILRHWSNYKRLFSGTENKV